MKYLGLIVTLFLLWGCPHDAPLFKGLIWQGDSKLGGIFRNHEGEPYMFISCMDPTFDQYAGVKAQDLANYWVDIQTFANHHCTCK
jgi:hypothetical protein